MNGVDLSTIGLLVFKIFVLIGLTVYVIFAAIMVRQEQLMAHVLEEAFEPVLRILAVIHFLLALGILVLAFFLL
ncbi:MAG: hypothetical protein Q7S76_00715 [bacterium]|nr:hypothetical protein [bacterium]